ncbi:hypothetical protein QWY28_13205 [Nocardioides sp. SOB77]|uniref:CBM-cenC domain-containing protein n=1 Tax=Nocardioides oceani TaxID=3058369 RepID=A0ABT8FHN8_9ACTN|nr:hypothetical protein [Nocardioides oceani]MDN4173912.1 hypothetical protein [Nocardioides oceani]
MKSLVSPPRDHLTVDAVRRLLTADEITITSGLDLLNGQNQFVADVSDDLVGWSVDHDNRDAVHQSIRLSIQRELAWGRDRVQPWMVFDDGITRARFNIGVFVLTTPDTRRGEDPITYDVTGYDLLSLLQTGPGDTYVVDPNPGSDMVPNGGFETDTTGWDSNPAFGVFVPAAWGRTTARSDTGVASLEVTWPDAPGTGQSWVNIQLAGFIVGKTYRLRARVWNPATGPDQLRLEAVFAASSPWQNVARDQWATIEWLWTATVPSIFVGVVARDTTAGQKTWIDSFTITPLSTTYFDAARAILDAAGIGTQLLVDGTLQNVLLPSTKVWALIDPNPTWLRMLHDLFAEIGYSAPWMDENGNVRTAPHRELVDRPVEWHLDTADESTNLVGEDRTLTIEAGDIANSWRFVRSNMDTTPVEGDGIYTPPRNQAEGIASIEAIGRMVHKTIRLDAADQPSLVAQGNRIVDEAKTATRTIDLTVEPLPVMDTDDVFQYTDAGTTEKVIAASWTLNSDGSPGRLQLGGAPRARLEAIETQVKATVTSADPLRVVVDGATQPSFANALDASSYAVGQRVTVTVRNPLPPLVQGVET